MIDRPLRFHWSMSGAQNSFKRRRSRDQQSGLIDFGVHLDFCKHAEKLGFEHLLTAIGFNRPDPLILASALGMKTEKINFLVACRTGIISPILFVQQVNSIAQLIDGRICVNMVAGSLKSEHGYYGDFLAHDERCSLDRACTIHGGTLYCTTWFLSGSCRGYFKL